MGTIEELHLAQPETEQNEAPSRKSAASRRNVRVAREMRWKHDRRGLEAHVQQVVSRWSALTPEERAQFADLVAETVAERVSA